MFARVFDIDASIDFAQTANYSQKFSIEHMERSQNVYWLWRKISIAFWKVVVHPVNDRKGRNELPSMIAKTGPPIIG